MANVAISSFSPMRVKTLYEFKEPIDWSYCQERRWPRDVEVMRENINTIPEGYRLRIWAIGGGGYGNGLCGSGGMVYYDTPFKFNKANGGFIVSIYRNYPFQVPCQGSPIEIYCWSDGASVGLWADGGGGGWSSDVGGGGGAVANLEPKYIEPYSVNRPTDDPMWNARGFYDPGGQHFASSAPWGVSDGGGRGSSGSQTGWTQPQRGYGQSAIRDKGPSLPHNFPIQQNVPPGAQGFIDSDYIDHAEGYGVGGGNPGGPGMIVQLLTN